MKTFDREPQQDRSRQTLEALLRATISILDKEGLEACTLPRVAASASVAAATVYRRFADKNALLRAAFLHVLKRSKQANQSGLVKALLRKSLEDTVERIVAALLAQYREHPRLLRALDHFIGTNSESEFAAQARGLINANLQLVAEVLLHHRDHIRHPNPARAVVFAVLQTSSAIETAVLSPDSLWSLALPLSDKQFAAELTRSMLAYLRRRL